MLHVQVSPSPAACFKYRSFDAGADLCLVCLFKSAIENIFEMSQGQRVSQEEEIAN